MNFAEKISTKVLLECCEIYFAYGSNMDRERIRKRCPSATILGLGILEEYKLVFNTVGNKAEGKGGGIANIIPSPGHVVYGVLYRIPKKELERLNNIEIEMNYEVKVLKIRMHNFETIRAVIYVGNNSMESKYSPTKEYKNFIVKGMRENQFPVDYQRQVIELMDN